MNAKLRRELPRYLTALPVYNEVRHVEPVLDKVAEHSQHVLAVDDGSTDGTSTLLEARCQREPDFHVLRHRENQGYGAALISAFQA